jgi:hypothetical protein
MEGIYNEAVEMASYSMTYIPSFMNIGAGVQAILSFASEICEAVMLVLLMAGICEVRR